MRQATSYLGQKTVISPISAINLKEISITYCNDQLFHHLKDSWSDQIDEIASEYSVDRNLVWIQTCLHAPLYSENELLGESKMPSNLLSALRIRLTGYFNNHSSFMEKCGGNVLRNDDESRIIKNGYIELDSNRLIPFKLMPVDRESGEFIEKNLHYLHSTIPISKRQYRYGMFIDGFTLPICYASITILDRYYKATSLSHALSATIELEHIINIARIYGTGHLPKNTISVLLAYAVKQLAKLDIHYAITAVNPMLGFSGTSMLASGFRPYAFSPVAYGYDEGGIYRTRRHKPVQAAQLKTPPNILFVRGITKNARRKVENITSMFNIPSGLHQDPFTIMPNHPKMTDIINTLDAMRAELEQVWDNVTRYQRLSYEPNDPISKGQCGVTSAYLAKKFQDLQYDVLFCEGNVKFPDGTPPIINHCWIKILDMDDNTLESSELIIDLTADQSGYLDSIVCDTNQSLRSKGIIYEQIREVEPKIIESGNLSSRLNSLQDKIRRFVPHE